MIQIEPVDEWKQFIENQFEQKLDQARALQSQYDIKRPILVDVWTELHTGRMGPFRTCCTS